MAKSGPGNLPGNLHKRRSEFGDRSSETWRRSRYIKHLMVASNSVARSPLSRQASPPASTTRARRWAGSCWLITMILIFGNSCRKRRATSRPPMPGMLISRRMTSGCSSCALSSASVPSGASPQISHVGSDDKILTTPRRTISLSSAMKIRKKVNLKLSVRLRSQQRWTRALEVYFPA